MTQPLRPGPDSAYPAYPSYPAGAQPVGSGRRLARRMVGAGAAVLVAGSALAVGLQAATPDRVQAPVPATTPGADAPTTSMVPAPSQRARDGDEDEEEGDEQSDEQGDEEGDEEAGAPVAKVAPVRAAPVSTPAPVASSGGSGR